MKRFQAGSLPRGDVFISTINHLHLYRKSSGGPRIHTRSNQSWLTTSFIPTTIWNVFPHFLFPNFTLPGTFPNHFEFQITHPNRSPDMLITQEYFPQNDIYREKVEKHFYRRIGSDGRDIRHYDDIRFGSALRDFHGIIWSVNRKSLRIRLVKSKAMN
ncbi:hypothetical protein TcasGA2_TC001973 [Tribolium castaneum]|uniref:Uncharacterized protein n=1 Tax=Tribolium castaneum TaxID=7070 RepID=D7EK53_TRICA|nr:hypothetical protein TcasGA2_TC001973 [Tribolium castaneum]